MARPILYPWLLAPVRLALSVYFRRIEVRGREHLPPRGPVVLAANHPQSITDALVLAASCDRVVHYLAHSGLFKNRLVAALLTACGVLPVVRRGDAPGPADNRGTFAACAEALARGRVIGIFPEGVSREERRLQPIKTGAARILLESGIPEAVLIPVGLSFQSQARFRSRVLVRFGAPIPAARWVEVHRADPPAAVQGLTGDLTQGLGDLVVQVTRDDLDDLVRELEDIYRDDLLDHPDLEFEGESRFQRETELSAGIARAVGWLAEEDPAALVSLRTHLREYREELAEWRIGDDVLRTGDTPTLRQITGPWLLALAGLPAAFVGALVNAVPYLATWWGVHRINPDPTKRHYHQLVYGTLACLVWYPLLLWFLQRRWNLDGWSILWVFLPMIPLGLFARAWGQRVYRERARLRFAYRGASRRAALGRLRRMRRDVFLELDGLRARYLDARRSDA